MNKVVRNVIGVSVVAAVVALVAACSGDRADATVANATVANATVANATVANANAADATAADTAPDATTPSVQTGASSAKPIAIKVYKTPQCGCCKAWVEHLARNGFQVESVDMPDLALVKQKYGVKPEHEACHTAVVGEYVVEGHVPADVIKRLLEERPAVAGIAVPGMPAGSPGMEGAMKERYDVLTFDRAGRSRVYAKR
ncbi:MAG: DUF411 domain-containing protein [Gemmatimonadota bacterium]|nr:DUF411 domain-containing protein [Gemmatimonadota bacterium]